MRSTVQTLMVTDTNLIFKWSPSFRTLQLGALLYCIYLNIKKNVFLYFYHSLLPFPSYYFNTILLSPPKKFIQTYLMQKIQPSLCESLVWINETNCMTKDLDTCLLKKKLWQFKIALFPSLKLLLSQFYWQNCLSSLQLPQQKVLPFEGQNFALDPCMNLLHFMLKFLFSSLTNSLRFQQLNLSFLISPAAYLVYQMSKEDADLVLPSQPSYFWPNQWLSTTPSKNTFPFESTSGPGNFGWYQIFLLAENKMIFLSPTLFLVRSQSAAWISL